MGLYVVRVLCRDGFRMEARVQAATEQEAWAQGAGLARAVGRESLVEFADLVEEPTLV